MFVPPFPVNFKPYVASGPTPFVGTYIGNVTLPGAPEIGTSAYSPVNGYLYVGAGTSVWVVDPGGTPSHVTTVSLTTALRKIAYLPVSNKVFVLQSSGKYQLIDCTTNTAATQVTMSPVLNATKCGSFSVNPATDDVYMQRSYQLGRVAPATGVATLTGFADTTYLNNMSTGRDICFNPADGYVYIVGDAAHALMSIDPATWTTNAGLMNDFGSISDLDANSKFVINRSTGHVYVHHPSTSLLSILTDFDSRITITPSATLTAGDYDPDLSQVFICETTSPPQFNVYADNDTLLLRTTVSGCSGGPTAIYCCPDDDRYAVQQTGGSSNVLQIIAR